MTATPRPDILDYVTMESAIGPLTIAGVDGVVHTVLFHSGSRASRPAPLWRETPAAFAEARDQLARYFAGTLRAFTAPIAPHGTAFQCRVWALLREIPYGETISYLELARRVGNVKAVRAVGLANGANPIPIIVPCHRVIGANGALVGFGGGLPLKRALLNLERGQGLLI